MSEITIRESAPFDLAAILKIEQANATAAHWNEDSYRSLWDDPEAPRIAFVAECEGGLVGFLVAHNISGEWELENVAVKPEAQRTGVGRVLVRKLLERLSQAGAERLLLEVRESNSSARRLYESEGFVITGRRKNYYTNPLEDALHFEKKFGDLSVKIR